MSEIVYRFRVSLVAISPWGATIIGLRNLSRSHGSHIIVFHKYLLMLFSNRENGDKLMKSCDMSILHYNAIVLCNYLIKKGKVERVFSINIPSVIIF